MHIKTRALFDIVSSEQDQSVSNYELEIDDSIETFGPMYCDIKAFETLMNYTRRDLKRTGHLKYILIISTKGNSMDDVAICQRKIVEILDISLRINDIYTLVSIGKVAILLDAGGKESCYFVANKIISRVYKEISKDKVHIMYEIVDLN